MPKHNATGSWIAAAVLLVVVVAAGILLVRRALQPEPAPAPAVASTAGAETPVTPAVRHPIGDAGVAAAASSALPLSSASDADVAAALGELTGGAGLANLLIPTRIIDRIVATVDTLPRHAGFGRDVLPLHPPRGAFATSATPNGQVIAADNAARYAPYMALLGQVDAQKLVAWYVRAYPLFQAAYRELGYPNGYFNDRLIVAIDDLLAAPVPPQPPAVQPTKAHYTYVDPALEALSTGQKLMLRTGAANAALIKAKLREIRAALVGHGPRPAGPAAVRPR